MASRLWWAAAGGVALIAALVWYGQDAPVTRGGRFDLDTARFFALVNLDYPGLEETRAAVQAGNYDQAVTRYIAWRDSGATRPRYFFEPGPETSGVVRGATEELAAALRDAQALRINRLPFEGYVFDLSDPPDFFPRAPGRLVTYAGRAIGKEWSRDKPLKDATLNGFEFTTQKLSIAYLGTGDEAYAAEFCDWVKGWNDQASLPDPYLAGDVTHPHAYFMVTAARRMNSWLYAQQALRGSRCLSGRRQFDLLLGIVNHALYVDASLGDALASTAEGPNRAFWFRPYSAPLVTVSKQANVLLMLPELKAREPMLGRAFDMLTRYVKTYVTAEGHEPQRDTNYHVTGFTNVMEVALLAELNGVALPAPVRDGLERSVSVLLRIIEPNGQLPAAGNLRLDGRPDAFFALGAELFNRADFAWFVPPKIDLPTTLAMLEHRRRRSDPPVAAARPVLQSNALPDTGFYVMRSGDGLDDSLYMLFDLAPGVGHVQRDALNVIAAGYGSRRPFNLLDDSGIGLNWPINLTTAYYYSERAHNVPVVDGQPTPSWTEDPRPIARKWMSLPSLDLAAGAYGKPYAGTEVDRTVTFVKGEYWLLRDRVQGAGEHRIEQLFNFSPVIRDGRRENAVAIDQTAKSALPGYAGPRLMVVPGDAGRVTARIDEGQKSHPLLAAAQPPPVAFEDVPSPTLVYETRANTSTPVYLETVLYPLRQNETRTVRTSPIAPRAAADAHGLRVEVGATSVDRFFVNETGAAVAYEDGTELLGRQAVVRATPDGSPFLICLIDGQRVNSGGYSIAAEMATDVCLRRIAGDRFEVETVAPAVITVSHADGRKVEITSRRR
jgi:hypothetical protein